jgi:ubiquinone/menaquinone biosynthesis C-methylase UbiE
MIEEEIETRVRLYDYSTGKQTFFQWQAGMLPSMRDKSVLELGCGNGAIWRELLFRWKQCSLKLTDIADDVLKAAETSLEPLKDMTDGLSFEAVDFNNLTFADESFDIILANHNLFYAKDVNAVIEKISSLLKPGGMIICSTIGKDHLHELVTLLRNHKTDLPWGAEEWADRFGLENGAHLLMRHFNHVDQFEYDNNLHVNSVEPVLSYLRKTMKGALSDWVKTNSTLIQSIISEQMSSKGYFRLTPHSGFFIAYKD